MSLASDSRKHAQQWFDVAERMPPQARQSALKIAEAWFQLAIDAAALERGQLSTPERPAAATVH